MLTWFQVRIRIFRFFVFSNHLLQVYFFEARRQNNLLPRSLGITLNWCADDKGTPEGALILGRHRRRPIVIIEQGAAIHKHTILPRLQFNYVVMMELLRVNVADSARARALFLFG